MTQDDIASSFLLTMAGNKSVEIKNYLIVEALTESQNPNVFWRVLKKRLLESKNETVTICNGLKLLASDGKINLFYIS